MDDARLAELTAEIERRVEQRFARRLADLEARLAVAERRADPSATTSPASGVASGDERIERRRLLGRGAGVVAGAVLGGTALVALDGSPAAAVPTVVGQSAGDDGVYGSSTATGFAGVHGTTATAQVVGVRARHTNGGIGLAAASSGGVSGIAINAQVLSNAGTAVLADASGSGGTAVRGNGTAIGLWGSATTAAGKGVFATSTDGTAVDAVASGTGTGVQGTAATSGAGVRGTGNQGAGVHGVSTSSYGVLGETAATDQPAILGRFTGIMGLGTGIVGQGGEGVVGEGTMGSGVRGTSLGSTGGRFQGGSGNLLLVADGDPGPARLPAVADTMLNDVNHDLWFCVAGGPALHLPGTWRKLAGPGTAGSLHFLDAPKRVYDSRAGFAPNDVAKGKLTNVTRVIDATHGGSGVPAGATAVLVQFAVTNTIAGGFGTLWANGQPDPGTASINWGQAGLTLNNSVSTRVDAAGAFQCRIAGSADVILDVVAYWR